MLDGSFRQEETKLWKELKMVKKGENLKQVNVLYEYEILVTETKDVYLK